MQKRLLVLAMLLVTVFGAQAQKKGDKAETVLSQEWNDVDVFEQNRVYPHANVVPYSDENGIEKWKYKESPNYVLLNGQWRCKVVENTSDRPSDMELKSFDPSGWDQVQVPASDWNGTSIMRAPILKSAVEIPHKRNAVGTYYRQFDVPKNWNGYRAFLQLQAKSAYYVWVNKEYVGYSEDSRATSEFDITSHLKVGKPNEIVIQVFSASDGSLLEMGYDHVLNGITGDVAICLKPSVNVADYTINTDFNATSHSGNFLINIDVSNISKKGQYYVEVELWNPKGKQLDKMGKWVFFDKKAEASLSFDRVYANGELKPWTAEDPNLYTAVLRVRDEKMNLLETVGTRFAFRNIEISGGRLLINGSPVTLRGVIYSGYSPKTSGLATREEMRNDVRLMKQNNINAVRTSVYSPIDPYFYELCDEWGLYVVCDANIQPFSTQTKAISTDANFANLFIARVQNMYERYKNHASIIAWSLGEGVDNGTCMANAYRTLKQKDKMRPVIFGGAEFSENTDWIASSNLTVDDLKQFSAKQQSRPLIMNSFGLSQGNNYGSLEPVWAMVRNNAKLQGGFASYWNGFRHYDSRQQKDVYCEGLVSLKGQPTPLMDELRNLYRGFDVRLVSITQDAGEFNVTNLMDYSSLDDYIMEYNICSNLKKRIVEGEVRVDLAPGESKNFKLKIPQLTLYAGEELIMRFTIRQRKDTEAVPKGTELGVMEFTIPMKEVRKETLPDYDRSELYLTQQGTDENGNASLIQIYNDNIELWYDLANADITSLKFNNEEFIASSPRFSFWRPATDNDRVDKGAMKLWQNLNPDEVTRTVMAANYRQSDNYTVGIDAMLRYTDKSGNVLFDVKQSVAVFYTGDVIIDNEVMVTEQVKAMPKVGMQMRLNADFDSVSWFGLSNESYSDRRSGSTTGTFSEKLDNMFYRYDKPQAAGNRAEVRWAAFTHGQSGLFVDMISNHFNFSAYPYSDNQLANAVPANGKDLKLNRDNAWTVNFDLAQSGIGSALAGVDLDENDMLQSEKYLFKLHLRPYNREENDPHDFRRIAYPTVESSVLPMAVISKNRERFDAPMLITITSPTEKSDIRYTVDGTTPTETSPLYKKPFTITTSTIVKAKVFKKGATASFTSTQRYNFDYIVNCEFQNKPNTPYNYNSESILFDGETGDISDLSRGWLGFSGSDFSTVFQLSKPIDLQRVILRFAHVPEAWAFAPKSMAVYVSSDGENYSPAYNAKIKYDPSEEAMNSPQLVVLSVDINQPDVKYVRVVARNLGKIPVWHKAKGLRPWIMVDEIQVNEVIR